MKRVVIFGNSGSGKSTLARRLIETNILAHLDLDTVAWKSTQPPQRQTLSDSRRKIEAFTGANPQWVIEGCYSDLLALVLPASSEIIYLKLPVETCVRNARQRPWEPHKYPSKSAQDANLEMLIDWIAQYETRRDTFSQSAHDALFENYRGKKTLYTANPM